MNERNQNKIRVEIREIDSKLLALKKRRKILMNQLPSDDQEQILYVLVKDLQPYLIRYLEDGNTKTGLATLSGVSTKTMQDIQNGSRRYTTDVVADRLMTAMELNHVPLQLYTFENLILLRI